MKTSCYGGPFISRRTRGARFEPSFGVRITPPCASETSCEPDVREETDVIAAQYHSKRAKSVLQFRANALDDSDDRKRDAGGDQTVLYGRGTGLIL